MSARTGRRIAATAGTTRRLSEVTEIPETVSADGHADLQVSYAFRCADASRVRHVDVGFFGLAQLRSIAVQGSTPGGQFKWQIPNGKLSWIGGGAKQGTQRVWLDGKPVSRFDMETPTDVPGQPAAFVGYSDVTSLHPQQGHR